MPPPLQRSLSFCGIAAGDKARVEKGRAAKESGEKGERGQSRSESCRVTAADTFQCKTEGKRGRAGRRKREAVLSATASWHAGQAGPERAEEGRERDEMKREEETKTKTKVVVLFTFFCCPLPLVYAAAFTQHSRVPQEIPPESFSSFLPMQHRRFPSWRLTLPLTSPPQQKWTFALAHARSLRLQARALHESIENSGARRIAHPGCRDPQRGTRHQRRQKERHTVHSDRFLPSRSVCMREGRQSWRRLSTSPG